MVEFSHFKDQRGTCCKQILITIILGQQDAFQEFKPLSPQIQSNSFHPLAFSELRQDCSEAQAESAIGSRWNKDLITVGRHTNDSDKNILAEKLQIRGRYEVDGAQRCSQPVLYMPVKSHRCAINGERCAHGRHSCFILAVIPFEAAEWLAD